MAAKAAEKAAVSRKKQVAIPAPRYDSLDVEIFGYTDLIVEQFAEKTRKQIADKHAGAAQAGGPGPRNPKAEYEALKYKLANGRDAFKVGAFMESMLFTASSLGVAKTTVRQAVRIFGNLTPILGYEFKGAKMIRTNKADVRMVEDPGKDARGGARLMYRPYYSGWRFVLRIQFRPDVITPEQIVNLLNHAGFSSGVGGWRPSSPKKSGTHGMFTTSEQQARQMIKQLEDEVA